MSEESDVEKTEEPTPHRKQKAREEGQIPRSKELSSLLMLLAGWALMLSGGQHFAHTLMQILHSGLMLNRLPVTDPRSMLQQASYLFSMMASGLLPILLGLFITGLLSPMLLGGVNFSGKSLKVDLARMSPMKGLQRMFSAQVLSEMLKGCLKVALAGCGFALYVYNNRPHFIQLVNASFPTAVSGAIGMIFDCLLMVIFFLLPVMGYDVFYQITSNLKKLRMSRQEIRDEFKQQEGDPHVKGRIKQMQRAAARNRMMTDVPKADVIVNNPTHYSVALSYKEGGMSAPTVLAKGAGEVALKIRELGAAHRIPMLEAPPLARALYRHCEIGEQIPGELYSAVAEVLAWVYGLRRWRTSGGVPPVQPRDLPVPESMDFANERN
ncbi:flagellar biosynthesis protein FlhB [Kosakonia oryzae]|uniref:Flagellar biosynthetic protein FlhB n=1 Tax=Kosakonia oryzae TaxID=497725 RepID=A0AA94H4W7_9ENTR|nr:flagellar biosynthesis protein FlhB [Kosakonia oryzae]ANI81729.1 flagellar type III secretion system protein FlhB [Kosakonia oryzae]UDJ83654.1 flagellar type III secretion system protein FlhB [Kosakonia oryzae]SFC75417.1 flagellar biosynthetic protein FlhB [Kosakonia oryzae]